MKKRNKMVPIDTTGVKVDTYQNYEEKDEDIDSELSTSSRKMKLLNEYATFQAKYMIPKMKETGIEVRNGHIDKIEPGSWTAGFIPGVAVNSMGEGSCCILANTSNEGLRFAGLDKDLNTIDLGPVDTACIIGNAYRPTGVYIPFTKDGFSSGLMIIDDAIKSIIEHRSCEDGCLSDTTSVDDDSNIKW